MDSAQFQGPRHELPRLFSRPDQVHDPLYVVVPIINSGRFRSRWKHFEDFAKHAEEAGAILYVVEVAFGARDFVVTQPGNPKHLQLRTHHELWLKERAINVLVQRLPADWKYVAWVDPDITFSRHDWANETLHLLQHYPIVQMWSHMVDLDPNYEAIGTLRSFMDVQLNGLTEPPKAGKAGKYGQAMKPFGKGQQFGSPGLAWAARREAWQQMGGLIDWCILGSGDWYFANAIWGTMENALGTRRDRTPPFLKKIEDYAYHLGKSRWEERSIVGSAGVMKGLVNHYWHGPRNGRQYGTRQAILARHVFDPERDLKTDWQGLYQLTDRSPGLRREIQRYFSMRNEDAL